MKLVNCLQEKSLWEEKGFALPDYDREAVCAKTKDAPVWVHFGTGNIFRAFFAPLQDSLLCQGLADRGIVAIGRRKSQDVESIYRPFGNMTLLVILKADGGMDKRVVGSVTESLSVDKKDDGEWARLLDIFASPSLQMATFTITEKGYGVTSEGSMMAQAAALCYHRFLNGAFPIALVSQDNCSQNGRRLFEAVYSIAEEWVRVGTADSSFLDYLRDPNRVSFPWSMVDKITPRPDVQIAEALTALGVENMDMVVTPTGTFTAPFVNAEETQYWVVEDSFPNGRPSLEAAGVIFTDRETVEKTERMKVCTCLNPLHTALAIFGCLLSYKTIWEEMRDEGLRQLVQRLGFDEGLPVVTDPEILSPSEFIRQVVEVRFPNPFIPDTPQRIACDTSQKLPIRFGETIKEYLAKDPSGAENLRYIPLVLAGWCRYLLGINDDGEVFELSPDPRLAEMRDYLKGVSLGDSGPFYEQLDPILRDASVFGVDLYEAKLAKKVHDRFTEMVSGPGAIRETLRSMLV